MGSFEENMAALNQALPAVTENFAGRFAYSLLHPYVLSAAAEGDFERRLTEEHATLRRQLAGQLFTEE